jgi:F-type H+-transporting ATPase subunit alpha
MGLSVSRVGTAAQTKAMKQVAGKLKLDLAQYRAMAAFAQFGSDLDAKTRATLDRGERITEMLKQPQYQPLSLAEEVSLQWAIANGYVDALPVKTLADFKQAFLKIMHATHSKLLDEITAKKALDDNLTNQLKKAVEEFVAGYTPIADSEAGAMSGEVA